MTVWTLWTRVGRDWHALLPGRRTACGLDVPAIHRESASPPLGATRCETCLRLDSVRRRHPELHRGT